MNVLFLALGATRRHVIVAEAEHVIAAGGSATVLVRKPNRWQNDPLPDGADMVDWRRLERGYRPPAARLLVDRAPLALLRLMLPGPLSGVRARAQSFHRRRVAKPVHQRLARLYRRDPARVRQRIIVHELVHGRSIDLIVIGDAESMVAAAELPGALTGSGARLAYTVAHERPPAGHVEG